MIVKVSQVQVDDRLWLHRYPIQGVDREESYRVSHVESVLELIYFMLLGHDPVSFHPDVEVEITKGSYSVPNPQDYYFAPVYILDEKRYQFPSPEKE